MWPPSCSAEDKKEDLVSAVIALQVGFNDIFNLPGLYQVCKIITVRVNGILQVDLLQKSASQLKPAQMAFRKHPVTKPLCVPVGNSASWSQEKFSHSTFCESYFFQVLQDYFTAWKASPKERSRAQQSLSRKKKKGVFIRRIFFFR